MPLTPMTSAEISELLDHTDICRLLDKDTTRLLDASNTATHAAPSTPVCQHQPGPAEIEAIWHHIRAQQPVVLPPAVPQQAQGSVRLDAPPVAQPIPTWAKSTALLAPTVGGGIALAAVGLSAAAPGLVAVSHLLWSAVAAIAAGGVFAAVLIGRVRARITASPREMQRPHITQHITSTGLFGRANGTINHR
ncbi:hypothetical protein ACFVT2_19690 [Streptomyces sp. NPDC058000]|uniref:hypothetical protein n=1 Tax=Streptomyces sp. NPDC058000 TaxID=3346299 RepID=UPI0036E4138D